MGNFGDDAALAQLSDNRLATWLPDSLRSWPVWYVRLPESWAADVPALASAPALDCYVGESEDPWYVAQYVALSSGAPVSADERPSRQVRVMDIELRRSLCGSTASNAVLVLIECGTTLHVTGFPLDEALLLCLQAGDAASCRSPTFGQTAAALQARVREIEAGHHAPQNPDCLTLPVLHYMSDEEVRKQEENDRFHEKLLAELPPVASHLVGPAAVGLLHTIVDFVPAGFDAGRGLWIRLTVPDEMFAAMLGQPPSANV